MMERKRILIIAHFFPPLGGAGVQRPLKFAKYLPDFGWDPIVLSVKNPDWHYAHDPELLKELPSDVKIIRSLMVRSAWFYRILNPLRNKKLDTMLSRFLIQPDDQVGWIPFAYFAAVNTIKRNEVKAVISTSGPYSSHLIGYFAKKKTGTPWIADFRDEWYELTALNTPTRFHRKYHYFLEGMVVRGADKVTAASPVFSRMLAKHCKNTSKFSTITNGFDSDDLNVQISRNKGTKKGSKFVISFIGLFYGATNPNIFLNSLTELIDEGRISPEKIKVQFVGANNAKEIDFKDNYGICNFTGYVSHNQALRFLSKSDALLLLLSDERGKGVIPGKTFEYIATGKPILAIVPQDGETAKIIKMTNTGFVIDPKDTKKMKKAYLKLFRGWEQKESIFKPDWELVKKFDRKKLTSNLAVILNELANH